MKSGSQHVVTAVKSYSLLNSVTSSGRSIKTSCKCFDSQMILILWVFHITLHGGLNSTLYSESSLVIFFLTCLRYGLSIAQLSSRISQGLSCPLVLSVLPSNTQGGIQESGCYIYNASRTLCFAFNRLSLRIYFGCQGIFSHKQCPKTV